MVTRDVRRARTFTTAVGGLNQVRRRAGDEGDRTAIDTIGVLAALALAVILAGFGLGL